MAGRDKDIDPASELVEDDEEQALPDSDELELDIGDGEPAPLAAGRAALLRHAKLAPSAPGVYRMLDAAGEVLYVGKAKNIKKRITSYTRPTGHDTRIERMIAATATMEFVTTATETEALLLEANLIKRLRPRFNVLLRDDKSFPYILITSDHWAPQILKHRGARSRRGSYYGPFASVWAVNRTITALQRAFLLRSCSDGFFESRTRPCLLHQIKRCSAPCTQRDRFRRICRAGARGQRLPLRQEPGGAGRTCRRDGEGLGRARFRARRDLPRPARRAVGDAVARRASIRAAPRRPTCSPCIRRAASAASRCSSSAPGRTGATAPISRKADRSLGPGEVLGAFLAQFYDDKPLPALILLSHDIRSAQLLAEALSVKSGRKVEVSVPQRGEKKELVGARAGQCARGAGAQARRHLVAAEAAQGAGRDVRLAARAAPHRGLRQQPHPGLERGRRHDRRRARRASRRTSTASSTSARPSSRRATTSA